MSPSHERWVCGPASTLLATTPSRLKIAGSAPLARHAWSVTGMLPPLAKIAITFASTPTPTIQNPEIRRLRAMNSRSSR